jgi:hypothetical protein
VVLVKKDRVDRRIRAAIVMVTATRTRPSSAPRRPTGDRAEDGRRWQASVRSWDGTSFAGVLAPTGTVPYNTRSSSQEPDKTQKSVGWVQNPRYEAWVWSAGHGPGAGPGAGAGGRSRHEPTAFCFIGFMVAVITGASSFESPSNGWERVRIRAVSARFRPFRAVSVEIGPFRGIRSRGFADQLSSDGHVIMWLCFRSVLPRRCARAGSAISGTPRRFKGSTDDSCARPWSVRPVGLMSSSCARRARRVGQCAGDHAMSASGVRAHHPREERGAQGCCRGAGNGADDVSDAADASGVRHADGRW